MISSVRRVHRQLVRRTRRQTASGAASPCNHLGAFRRLEVTRHVTARTVLKYLSSFELTFTAVLREISINILINMPCSKVLDPRTKSEGVAGAKKKTLVRVILGPCPLHGDLYHNHSTVTPVIFGCLI
ncbi:hypothetical protein EVAR_33340_1 [Eumeta japonica]|uniref:Uncharacterized protein n=1 Tax=Eumeta variegata TaxID=151549 RepID=A0A4C1YMB5_EUMVA|nr:hypothetical protein EVAR_33340_1 [Eumeta japonica]